MTASMFGAMSASHDLQRQLKRLELCLPRANRPWMIHEIKHDGFRILAERDAKGRHPAYLQVL